MTAWRRVLQLAVALALLATPAQAGVIESEPAGQISEETGAVRAESVIWSADGSLPPEAEWASVADQINCTEPLAPGMLPDGRISFDTTGFAATSSKGRGAYHFHVSAHDQGCFGGRSELALGNPERAGFPTFAEGQEYWLALETAIAANFSHGSLMQLHERAGPGSPPLKFGMEEGYVPSIDRKTTSGPGEGEAIEHTPLAPLKPNTWYRIVMHLRFATASPSGLVAIYTAAREDGAPQLVYERNNVYLGTAGYLPTHLRVGNYVDSDGPEQDSWLSGAAIATSREAAEHAAWGTLPTSKSQCKKGAWKNFGTTFKNQGQCVSFVATGGKHGG